MLFSKTINSFYHQEYDNRAIYYGLLVYISSFVFEGVIRYFLHFLGLEYLIYFRDIILLLFILYYILFTLTHFTINKVFLIVIFIMMFHSIIGFIFVRNIFLILFGWKIFLPFLCGILFGFLFITHIKSTNRVFLLLVFCAILGIFLNYYQEFPWGDLQYKLGGFDIEAVRSWETFDFRRLSGASRASFDAAIQILLLSIFLIQYLKSNYVKIIVWVLAGPAILLTTTKGIVITYIIITMGLLAYWIVPNYHKIYQKILFIPLALVIAIPLFSNYISQFNMPLILASFLERIMYTYPDSFRMIQNNGNWLLGRGLGGMGTGQLFFELDKYSPGDNIFMYAYGNFGVFSILYFIYFAIISQSLELKSELFYYLLILSLFVYGIVTAAFENALFNLFLGMFIGYIHNTSLREYSKSYLLKS
jgi:hypothetical protein